MSCRHTDRIRARLLDGHALSAEESRHVTGCSTCQSAVRSLDSLDAELRRATAPLAAEPIPAEVLDIGTAQPATGPQLRGWPVAGVGVALAAVVGVLVLGPLDGRIGADPAATGQPRPPVSDPATPPPAAQPMPTPTPPEPPTAVRDDVDPHLVGPLDTCSDGTAGFAIILPEGWYANRHEGDSPACRTIGSVRSVGGRQHLDPLVYVTVHDAPPVFEGATIEERVDRTVPSGVEVTRMTVHTPESGALASSDEVVYLATLADGRVLTAVMDAGRSVVSLDRMMDTLELFEPITIDPAAIAEAEALFADRDVCQDPQRGLGLVFPDAWWANTAIDDLPACSWFAPTSFEYVASDQVPDEVEITIFLAPGPVGTIHEILATDSMTMLGRPASRWLLDEPDGPVYEYTIALSESVEDGPTLVARTSAAGDELDLAMAVLDQLVTRLTLAGPPPGATSSQPPIPAPPATASATEGDFRLELVVEQERYRAGQPIVADATLTYRGQAQSVQLWGSGMGVIGTTVRQLDGPIDPGMAFTLDCVAHPIGPDAPMHQGFEKSGSFSAEDPLAEFYEAYFADPLLRLPPGRWEIVASASFTVGGGDCGAGPPVSLDATVEIVVEP